MKNYFLEKFKFSQHIKTLMINKNSFEIGKTIEFDICNLFIASKKFL